MQTIYGHVPIILQIPGNKADGYPVRHGPAVIIFRDSFGTLPIDAANSNFFFGLEWIGITGNVQSYRMRRVIISQDFRTTNRFAWSLSRGFFFPGSHLNPISSHPCRAYTMPCVRIGIPQRSIPAGIGQHRDYLRLGSIIDLGRCVGLGGLHSVLRCMNQKWWSWHTAFFSSGIDPL